MAARSSFGFGERVLRVVPKRIGPGNRMRGSGVGGSVRECLTTTSPMFSFVSWQDLEADKTMLQQEWPFNSSLCLLGVASDSLALFKT